MILAIKNMEGVRSEKEKNIVFGIFFALLLIFGVCVMTVWRNRPQEMPPIVFMCCTQSCYDSSWYTVFIDKQGNKYYTVDEGVQDLSYIEKCEKHSKGELKDAITLMETYDVDEVYKNYKLLKKISSKKGFELVPDDEHSLGVETDEVYWMGGYYDEENELSLILLQTEGAGVTYYGNDENAVKICEWFEGTENEK